MTPNDPQIGQELDQVSLKTETVKSNQIKDFIAVGGFIKEKFISSLTFEPTRSRKDDQPNGNKTPSQSRLFEAEPFRNAVENA